MRLEFCIGGMKCCRDQYILPYSILLNRDEEIKIVDGNSDNEIQREDCLIDQLEET